MLERKGEGFPDSGNVHGVSHTVTDEGNLRLIEPGAARLGAFTKPATPQGLAGFHFLGAGSLPLRVGLVQGGSQGADR